MAPTLLVGQDAPPAPSDQGLPAIQIFSRNDYGAHSQNWAIVKDRRGVMYFGNGNGVLEYDGVSWRLIRLPHRGAVASLARDAQGRIYVGARNEFGYLAPDASGQLQYVSLIDQLPSEYQNFGAIVQTLASSHGIYFKSQRGLLRWLPDEQHLQWTIRSPVNPSSASRAQAAPQESETHVLPLQYPPTRLGRAYIVHDIIYMKVRGVGLMMLQGDSLHFIPGSERFTQGAFSDMVPSHESTKEAPRILIANPPFGLWLYDGATFSPFQTDPMPDVFHAAPLSDGGWALGLRANGLARIDAQGRLHYILNKATGLPNQRVLSIYADDQGGLWIAFNEGLARVETLSPLSLYQDALGLADPPLALTKHQGRLYAGTTEGVRVASPEPTAEGFQVFEPVQGTEAIRAWSLLSIQETLLGGLGRGTHRIEGNEATLLADRQEGTTWVVYPSPYDSTLVYIGTQSGLGLVRKLNGQWQFIRLFRGAPEHIQGIAEEARGLLWVSTADNQLHRLELTEQAIGSQAGVLARDRVDAGLPSGTNVPLLLEPGQVIVATRQGLRRFDEDTQRFVPDSTLGAAFADITRTILQVSERPQGGFWIASRTPERQEVSLVVEEEPGRYATSLSFDVSQVEFGNIPALYPDPEQADVVWVGTTDGLLRYDATLAREPSNLAPVLVRRVVARGDSLVYGGYPNLPESDNADEAVLAYRDNALRFEFAALHYAKPEQNQYQTRLDGFDEAWSAWSAEAQKDYTNLPEGDYVFRVRGRDETGQISESEGYAFTIRPPWYRSWWAYLLYLAGAGGVVVLLVQFRVAQMQRKTDELEVLITERTSALRQKTTELEAANEHKSRFLANISHEFRTPLTLTFGPLDDLLNGRYHVDEAARPHLERARRNGSRLLRLINQLLDLSKLDAGALLLRPKQQDLAQHLRQLAALFDSIAEAQSVHYSARIPSEPLWHVYDADKIEKVVINLLSNAFKFTPQGHKVGLSMEQEAADGTVRILVADTGPGIPEEALPHLFDRFYQVEGTSTRSHEGSGIGLALVKELVELHEGMISVESQVGFGTRFTVRLPLLEHDEMDEPVLAYADNGSEADTDAAPWEAAPDEAERVEHTISGSLRVPKRPTPETAQPLDEEATVVLVVEDNADMRQYIRGHLAESFTLIEAENGRLGLEQAREVIPDLVLSDVMMPEMDGLDLCAALKADTATSHIPVVLLTAKAQVEHRIAGFESGADAYLPKPFNAEELIVRVHTLITERQRLRAVYGAQAQHADEPGQETEGADASSAPERVLPPREAAFLEQVGSIISEQLGNTQFGVDRLAEEIMMSRRQLLRKVRALIDETPAALIRRKRLERSAALLREEGLSVKEVAYAVGFMSESAFSQAFRKHYGVPPSAYAQQINE